MVTASVARVAEIALNARRYGVRANDSADDTNPLRDVIEDCIARGGGAIELPPGNSVITGSLPVDCGSNQVAVTIAGSGRRTSRITQATSATDTFVCGVTSADRASGLVIRDLSLSGGRYPLRLNNVLAGSFERLDIDDCVTGVYMEGQNESHTFHDLSIGLCSAHAIHAGNVNGGPAGVMNYPIAQKCLFEKLRVYICAGTGILITAGSLGGNAQSSGQNTFRKILLESNAQHGIEIDNSFNTTITEVSSEEAPNPANTWSIIRLGAGGQAGTVSIRDCFLAGVGSNSVSSKYCIEAVDALVLIERCVTGAGAPAGTADIFISDLGAVVIDSVVTDLARFVVSAPAKARTTIINLRDSGGNVLVGLGVPNSAAATTLGSVVRKLEVFDGAGVSLGFVPIYGSIT